MWKITDIKEGETYRLVLTQSETGRRIFILQEESKNILNSSAVFATEMVPTDLLLKRNLKRIADSVSLIGGERFYVDAHGIWLTQMEMSAIIEGKEDDEVPWLNGMPPHFAPK